MTGAKLEYHTKAVFTLKSMVDGTSTTVSVSNVQESTVSAIVWPILKAIGAVGVVMGDFLPVPQSSSVTLKNAYGSIGDERRFSDLLERYSLINQQVLIYVAASAIGSFTSGDYELRWAGTVKRMRERDEDLVIDIAGRGIQDRVVNQMVSREKFDTLDTFVDRSAGYALPIIIGQNVQVKPVILTGAVLPGQTEYVYATNLCDYVCEGLQKIYVKAHDGEYCEVQGSANATDELLGSSYNAGKSNAAWSANTEYAHRFQIPDPGYIAYSAHIYVYKAAGVAAGDLDIAIQTDDYLQIGSSANWDRAPGTVLAQGNYQLDQLAAGAGAYKIQVGFDKPAVLKPGQNWFLTYRLNGDTTGFIGVYFDAAVTEAQFYKTTSETLWREDAAAKRRYWAIYAVEIDDYNPYGSSVDNTAAWVQIYQDAIDVEVPSLTGLDLIFEVNGLKDDSSGTVTGVANQLIESPQHATELLTKQFNGTTYTGGQFGSEHSATWTQVNSASSTYFRELSGKTTGSTKLSQFLEQICRASACRITMHPSASTPMGFWAWGSTQTVADYINQDECEVLNAEILGTESVINAVEMFYAEKLVGLDYVTGSALGEFKTFSARFNSLDSTQSYYDQCNRFSSISRTIFGNLYLDSRTQQWIGDATSAKNLALSLLARFAFPSVYYDIELPYQRFKSLKLLDVIILTHPKVAAFFGTTPSASDAVYVAGGVDVDLSTGFHWARANSSRFQIEGLSTIFDSENTPRIRASVRLLNNPNDPT